MTCAITSARTSETTRARTTSSRALARRAVSRTQAINATLSNVSQRYRSKQRIDHSEDRRDRLRRGD
jgi:hypothetical protein